MSRSNKSHLLLLVLITICCSYGCKVVNVPVPVQPLPETADVGGLVRNPTGLILPADGMKLWSSIVRAGGYIVPEGESPDHLVVTLSRLQENYHFALALVEHDYAGEIQLQKGDVVHVSLIHESFPDVTQRVAIRVSEGEEVSPTSLFELENELKKGDQSQVRNQVTFIAETDELNRESGICSDSNELAIRNVGESNFALFVTENGQAASIILLQRENPWRTNTVDYLIFPTRRYATELPHVSADVLRSVAIDPFSDLFTFTRLEQLPIVQSSLIAPHLYEAMHAIKTNQAKLAVAEAECNACEGVPVIGPVVDFVEGIGRKCRTVTVQPYPVESPYVEKGYSTLAY